MAPKLLRHAGDVGVTMGARRVPLDTKPSCKLCSKGGLVDAAGRLLLGEEVAAVERPPRTVGAAHLGRDEQVGVQLGIEGPAGAVDVGGDDQAVAVELEHPGLARPREGGVFLQVVDSGGHRGVVGRADFLAQATVTEAPQQRHGLGRRQRNAVAGDDVGVVVVPRAAERLAADRVAALAEQATELFDLHPTAHAGHHRPSTHPAYRAPRRGRRSSRRGRRPRRGRSTPSPQEPSW